jgi:Mg-chelatase subunit ChlD
MDNTTTATAAQPNLAAIQAKLSEYDIIICIDKSGSMGEPVKAGSTRTRWQAVQESAMQIIRDASALDSDGLGLVVFGGPTIDPHDGVTPDSFKDIFANYSPRGGTPLAEALQAALGLAGKSDKKDFIIVFTDGVPDDEAAAAQVIIDQANKQETDDALTILFIQVGDDPHATAYLQKLDDNLTGAKFDIVDAKTVAQADAYATTSELLFDAISD